MLGAGTTFRGLTTHVCQVDATNLSTRTSKAMSPAKHQAFNSLACVGQFMCKTGNVSKTKPSRSQERVYSESLSGCDLETQI